MKDYERDGKVYSVGHAQAQQIESGLKSKDKNIVAQCEKLIRRTALHVVTLEGEVEKEYVAPVYATVTQGPANSDDLI
jgi:hypothetical protein